MRTISSHRSPSAHEGQPMPGSSDLVQRLWSLCNVLRDDGITYHEYVTELSYLIFLKMAQETGTEDQLLEGYRWPDLVQHSGDDQLRFFRDLLYHLGTHSSGAVRSIFANAATSLHQSRNLNKLVQSIDTLDLYSARREGLGELYEGLLEKNAGEKKS